MDSTGTQERCRLRLSKFKSSVAHGAWISHQASDTLLRLGTTCKDETKIEDDIPILWLTLARTPENEEASCMYMQKDVEESDKQGVGLPEV